MERAAFEGLHRAGGRTRPFGKEENGSAATNSFRRELNGASGALRIRAIENKKRTCHERPPPDRNPRERAAQREPQIIRNPGEQDGDVHIARMIRDVNIVPTRLNMFRSQNAKANAKQEQSDLAPCASLSLIHI